MGTLWNRSSLIERDSNDRKASGAKAYFYQGGTLTLFTVYQNATEATAHPNPVVSDANGRWPDVFIPYTVSYDVRVTTADDVQISYTRLIPNPDPIDLSVTIPAEAQVQTGMIHSELINTTKSGYVRLNGRTIGNAASSGTERANADTSALFIYLWNGMGDAQAPVSGGRGGSASADFAANKTITLPNLRGAIMVGLDDMGNSAAGRFTGLTFTQGSALLPGSQVGSNTVTLTSAEMPSHTHAGLTDADGAHTHGGVTGTQSADHTHGVGTLVAANESSHTHTAGGLSAAGGGGHNHGGATQGHSVDHTHNTSFSQLNNIATTGISSALQGAGGAVTVASGGSSTDHTHAINFESDHTHSLTGTSAAGSAHTHTLSGSTAVQSASHTHTIATSTTHTHNFTTSATGSGGAHSNMPISFTVTWYIKL